MPACLSNHFPHSPLSFLQSFYRIGAINESLSILRDQRESTKQRHSKPDVPFMPACLSNHFPHSPLSFLQSFYRIGTINESLFILSDQTESTKQRHSKPDAPFMPACLSNHFPHSPLSFLQSFYRIRTINES